MNTISILSPNGFFFLAATVFSGTPLSPVRPAEHKTHYYVNISATYSLCTGERCDVSREWPRTGNTAFSCEQRTAFDYFYIYDKQYIIKYYNISCVNGQK